MSAQKHPTFVQEKAKVELFISCRKLKNMDYLSLTDPQVKLYIERKDKYELFDQTEVKNDNLNPDFSKTFILDYYFEIKQKLKFEIVDIDYPNNTELVGEVFTTLGAIVGSRNQTAVFDIMNKSEKTGKLVIKCEQVAQNLSSAFFEFYAENLGNGARGFFSKLILKLSRLVGDSGYVLIYESESNSNPEWKGFELGVQKLCNDDYFRPVKVEIFSRAFFQEKLVGECQFTLNEVNNQKICSFTLINSQNKGKSGLLRLRKFNYYEEKGDFLKYLRGGVQLNVILAVDFTLSNGNPRNSSSLHAIKSDGSLNEYQRAISGVCDILLDYDHDKTIPFYGFGGVPKYPEFKTISTRHCFPVKGKPRDICCVGLEEVMAAYANALQNISLSGPTYFAPILQQAIKISQFNKAHGSNEYSILLIITDGEIHDMEQTINCIIESANLPLSVIIVGVGSANFSKMETLDGDDGLSNSKGVKAKRDLVQFVPFRKFQGKQEELAKHVLEEIPNQLVEYMVSEGIKPNPCLPVDINSILERKETTMIDNEDYNNILCSYDQVSASNDNPLAGLAVLVLIIAFIIMYIWQKS